jgi:enoyl-CoA hydratase
MPTTHDGGLVLYEARDEVAIVTLNRPKVRNAQNSAMLYALDDALSQAAADDAIMVVVLRGAGGSFSAGHDIGPGRDVDKSYERMTLNPDHVGKPDGEARYLREAEVYLGLTWRWRELPKPTIAMVHGGCIGGGLMLAWACDMIVASEDAFFADPVVTAGAPSVEFFAHPWQMGARFAKEFLFLGESISAIRAEQIGMVNRVVPRDQLERVTLDLARRIARRPRFPLMLAKRMVNNAEELMGLRAGIESSFGYHLLAQLQVMHELGRSVLVEKPTRVARPRQQIRTSRRAKSAIQ